VAAALCGETRPDKRICDGVVRAQLRSREPPVRRRVSMRAADAGGRVDLDQPVFDAAGIARLIQGTIVNRITGNNGSGRAREYRLMNSVF
jgi:hypothetical protein